MVDWLRNAVGAGMALAICSLAFTLICWGIVVVFKKIERAHFKMERKLNIGGPNRNRFRDPKKNRIK